MITIIINLISNLIGSISKYSKLLNQFYQWKIYIKKNSYYGYYRKLRIMGRCGKQM